MNSSPNELLVIVGRRLFLLLVPLLLGIGILCYCAQNGAKAGEAAMTPCLVFFVGVLGGFVGIQRRLPDLPEEKLRLMQDSYLYTLLSPIVGGVLAFLLYLIFLGEVLQGQLFPKFAPDCVPKHSAEQFLIIFDTHTTYQGYAMLMIWSFVAGYSEKFVTNIIGHLEQQGNESAPKNGDTKSANADEKK